jgi:hypothetical protein
MMIPGYGGYVVSGIGIMGQVIVLGIGVYMVRGLKDDNTI